MSWFRSRTNNAKPDYTALQLNTSTSTLPVPIIWGQNKLAGNVIWYNRFWAMPQYVKSGGKGGSRTITGYNYYCDLMIALCEGPISNILWVWQNQTIVAPWYLGFSTYFGTTSQTPWWWLTAIYPGQDLTYPSTAYVAAANYNLGTSASIGNLNFEIVGPLAGSGVNGIDADPALVISDFLTNAQYGAGFNPASIDATALFGSGGDASLQTWCKAMGWAFSPVLSSQEQGSSILTRWLQLLSCAAVWSGGMLKFIPYGDTGIAAGMQTNVTQQFSIPTPIPASTGYALPASVTVAGAAQFVSDGGVTYASTSVPLIFIGGLIPTVAGTYGMSPAGTYIFAPADEGKPVNVTYTTAAATTYTPNLTPVYALTDDDFIDEKGNKDPLQVERADVFSLPTIQRIEVSSRSNRYAAVPVEARDQSQIEVFGPRVGSVIQAHEICDEHTMGPSIAQAILQRELYVRTNFKFKLSAEYCLLDPMDIVTITDANLGLSNYPVRIIQIEEDDKGLLAITAEELVFGVSTPSLNPSASAGNYSPNAAAPAVPVNPPLIWQPPLAATSGVAQLWVGASGVNAGGQNQWGGCNVYASTDGVTFNQIPVTITASLRQGVLTAALAAANGWDAIDTLSVNLSASGGTLSGTTQAAAQQGATLALVDSELLAYQNANLVAGSAYNLTGLARGLSGTSGAYHSTGAAFCRLDSAVVTYDLPANLQGQTLFFKFQSFNAWGGGLQDLASCATYVFTPSGVGDPIATQLASGFPLDLGQAVSGPTVSDDFGAVTQAVGSAVDLGPVAATAHPIAIQLLSGAPLSLGLSTAYPIVADDFGVVVDPVIDVINLGTAP